MIRMRGVGIRMRNVRWGEDAAGAAEQAATCHVHPSGFPSDRAPRNSGRRQRNGDRNTLRASEHAQKDGAAETNRSAERAEGSSTAQHHISPR